MNRLNFWQSLSVLNYCMTNSEDSKQKHKIYIWNIKIGLLILIFNTDLLYFFHKTVLNIHNKIFLMFSSKCVSCLGILLKIAFQCI